MMMLVSYRSWTEKYIGLKKYGGYMLATLLLVIVGNVARPKEDADCWYSQSPFAVRRRTRCAGML